MIVGLLYLGMVAIAAVSIDLARLGALRAELQIAADAGAHAGAVQLLNTPSNVVAVVNAAQAFALANLVLQLPPTIDQVQPGWWNGSTFDPSPPVTNAVRVQVSRQASGLIMGVLGVPAPVVHASAIGSVQSFPPPGRAVLVK